jgi:hypothetical protein
MDLLICHSCGTVLRGKLKNCTGCSLPLSDTGPTPLPTLSRASDALAVMVRPDPIVLERLLVRHQSQVWLSSKRLAAGGVDPGAASSDTRQDPEAAGLTGSPASPGALAVGAGGTGNFGNGGDGSSVPNALGSSVGTNGAQNFAPDNSQSLSQGNGQANYQPPVQNGGGVNTDQSSTGSNAAYPAGGNGGAVAGVAGSQTTQNGGVAPSQTLAELAQAGAASGSYPSLPPVSQEAAAYAPPTQDPAQLQAQSQSQSQAQLQAQSQSQAQLQAQVQAQAQSGQFNSAAGGAGPNGSEQYSSQSNGQATGQPASPQAAGGAANVDFFDTPVAKQMNPGGAQDVQTSSNPSIPSVTANGVAFSREEVSAPPPAMPAIEQQSVPPNANSVAAAAAGAAAGAVAGAVAGVIAEDVAAQSRSQRPPTSAADLDFFAATQAYPGGQAPSTTPSQTPREPAYARTPEPSGREAPSADEMFAFDDEANKLSSKSRPSKSTRIEDDDDDDDDDDADDFSSKSSRTKSLGKKAAPVIKSRLGQKSRGSQIIDYDDEDHDHDDDDDDDDKNSGRGRKAADGRQAAAKSGAKGKKRNLDDDDDDDDAPPPARRTFSGDSPTFKSRPPAKRDSRKPSPSERIANRGKSSAKIRGRNNNNNDDDDSNGSTNFLTQEVNVIGFSMKRQTQLIAAVVALVIVVPLFNIVGGALSGLFAGAGGVQQMMQPAAEPLLLGGNWKLSYNMDGQHARSTQMRMQYLPNDMIMGDGVDGEGATAMPYIFKGGVQRPDKISFRKEYQVPPDAESHPYPVDYFGVLDLGDGRPRAHGIWKTKKHVGHFLTAKTVDLQGNWEAELIRAHTYIFSNEGPASSVAQPGSTSSNPIGNGIPDPKHASIAFVQGLLVFLGIAIFLVYLVWNLFGTNGIMSVKGKRQYIPSQYKGDHRKVLRQLGKPVVAGSMPLGTRFEWKPYFPWEKKELALPPEVRNKDPHMLVLGAGDKGKTRFIASLVAHDIESNDRAVVVIDSDGNLIDMMTRWMSHHPKGKQFAKRVILLDPTNKKGSLAYNPLEMPEDGDLQTAASSLVYGFKAIYTEPPGSQSQWNAQTANILRNSALLLMANGKTLTDLPTLLQDNDFRDILLENVEKKKRDKVEYGTLLDTWGQYKRLARTDQWITWVEPILNRVGPMLSDPRIRPILTKANSEIRMSQVIKEKKILLVKIAKGQLDENANLLGSLIVTGLKQAAMALNSDSEEQPSALYLDEFDDFIEKETLEAITTETDRFQIGFVGSIKTLQHLPEDFRNQLVISVGTMACFALSKKDGDLLGPQMFRVDGRKIKHQTMSNFFNPVNTSPQFELISDEEKLNIDRVVGQDARNFYCYRVGSQAGVFHMKTHDFNDIDDKDVNWKLIERMQSNGTKPVDKES